MAKPKPTDYPEYFGNYINQVIEEDLPFAFANQAAKFAEFLKSIPEEKWSYAYLEGKWTIKEMVQHIIDSERVFAYRALCFARRDKTSLASFDENNYAAYSEAHRRTKNELIVEFESVRDSTQRLFESFTDDMLAEVGSANNKSASVLSLGFIILGHFNHHRRILEERYL